MGGFGGLDKGYGLGTCFNIRKINTRTMAAVQPLA
jgi:hypothetical protein